MNGDNVGNYLTVKMANNDLPESSFRLLGISFVRSLLN